MHRRESILQAVQTLLTGLTTTGTRVTRSRAWPVDSMPALTIAQGADQVLEDDVLDSIQRELDIEVTAHTQAGQQHETDLNTISTEVYAAMVADRTLGLDYVFDLNLSGESAPAIEGEQDQTLGQMTMNFTVRYQHSETSTEA